MTAMATCTSATWCGYCKDLKRYLAAKKIPATIIEVDRLPQGEQGAARATMQRLTGRVAFPTVIIGGEAPQAARRHAGEHGSRASVDSPTLLCMHKTEEKWSWVGVTEGGGACLLLP